MLDIQLVLNASLMKESLATETQWTPQASVQASGQCRLARCPASLSFPLWPDREPLSCCSFSPVTGPQVASVSGRARVPSGRTPVPGRHCPWWSVSGTSGVGLSSSARAPGSNPDRPPRSGGWGRPCPEGTLRGLCLLGPEGVNGCPRGSKACSGGPLTCRGPSKRSGAPSLGQGLRAASSVLHARQAGAAHLLQVLSAGPATEGAAPF